MPLYPRICAALRYWASGTGLGPMSMAARRPCLSGSIALNGREFYVVFDSDVMVKRPAHQALARLRGLLQHRGAHVWLINLPESDGGAKVGLDDNLAAGHS